MSEPDLLQCFDSLARAWQGFAARLTPREQLVLKYGLHASHAEEALVSGDIPRARAHFITMQEIAVALR